MKRTIAKRKNTQEGLNSRSDLSEVRINELADRSVEIMEFRKKSEKMNRTLEKCSAPTYV